MSAATDRRNAVLDAMQNDRARLVRQLRDAKALPQSTRKEKRDRRNAVGRRERELATHDRLIERKS